MQQTDSAAHKLKPRSFHKSTHLQFHFIDFHPGVNHAWQEKTNTKADILSRKDQVDTKEDNKDIKMLKNEL